ncbi:MAG: ATP-binding protein [Deltaproteobacteria bacterium]|nr:ATP-binding protein [Deltaproteobacteria bacterium]
MPAWGAGRRYFLIYTLFVDSLADRFAAAELAQRAARSLGFGPRARAASGIIAAELAENMVRYAKGGRIEISTRFDAGALRIAATDHGPSFRDIRRAFADGSTDEGPIPPEHVAGRLGFGSGLGAVRRLSDAVVISADAAEKSIIADVARDERLRLVACPLTVHARQDESSLRERAAGE